MPVSPSSVVMAQVPISRSKKGVASVPVCPVRLTKVPISGCKVGVASVPGRPSNDLKA